MKMDNARTLFEKVGAEAVLTEQPDLRQYLTGLETSFGYVLTDKTSTVFYTDSRYIEGAKKALAGKNIEVKLYEGSLEKILKGYKEVAIPIAKTYHTDFEKLAGYGVKIVDSGKAFDEIMSVKHGYEIENIRLACNAADNAFASLLPRIKEGMSENDVAAELEYLMRKNGASSTSFSTIVAFEKNSSVPHHETCTDKLKFGNIVLIDFGCKVNGYCSDCTRTFLFGDDGKHGNFKTAYSHVLNAHMLVKEKLVSGDSGKTADGYARNYFKENGLDKFFTHALGHGIGINVHESPVLSPRSEEILSDNMVFSDEPGVYFAGEFGIRIEDTVMLSGGKVVSLTDSNKNLIIL